MGAKWRICASIAALGLANVANLGGMANRASADALAADVQFADCSEYVGIGLVPFEAARAQVPSSFTLVEVGENAILVVRVSGCDAVTVDGGQAHAGRVAQVGITVAGLDETADINNYTLFYVTNLGALHGKLAAIGVPVKLDAQLLYQFSPVEADLESVVDAPQTPLVTLLGTASPPVSTPTMFIASWWAETKRGPVRVRMRTVFPAIAFGDASVTLSTDPASTVEALVGAMPYTFGVLDSYNTFDDAAMTVEVVP